MERLLSSIEGTLLVLGDRLIRSNYTHPCPVWQFYDLTSIFLISSILCSALKVRHIRKAVEKWRKGREKERQSDWAIDDVSLWSWGSTPERDNYYASENKIDLTQVLRLLNLQDEGEQKCRVIVSHFHTHYVIMPNDYNNSVNILI